MKPETPLYLDAKELADGLAVFEYDLNERLWNIEKDVAGLTDRVDELVERVQALESEELIHPDDLYVSDARLSESGLARLPRYAVAPYCCCGNCEGRR